MKTFYLYIVLLLSLGCKAQEFDLRSMKRFDEKVFKDWEVDTSKLVFPGTTYLKKGNDRVEISIGEKSKQIKLTNIIDPYMYVYRYYPKTNILMQETKFFYSVLIGKTYTYNEKGKLIKEENWDAPYKVSIEELITICKQKLNLDLLDKSLKITIHRYNEEKAIYIIRIPFPNTRNTKAKYITISADNGEILLEKEIHSKEEYKESMEEIHNPSLNKK
ncbi:hypothetical protein [Capnocytophaga sputigena]|uniref:hypothetical protein n=1 Tax=Capnocytophaga sputigena TaxID=1019 RepID=UPI0028EDBDE9|nr:hypothetical protein [Capnocytophaga sputigena]